MRVSVAVDSLGRAPEARAAAPPSCRAAHKKDYSGAGGRKPLQNPGLKRQKGFLPPQLPLYAGARQRHPWPKEANPS